MDKFKVVPLNFMWKIVKLSMSRGRT